MTGEEIFSREYVDGGELHKEVPKPNNLGLPTVDAAYVRDSHKTTSQDSATSDVTSTKFDEDNDQIMREIAESLPTYGVNKPKRSVIRVKIAK